MSRTFEGNLIGTGLKVGIVVARFNEFITGKLLSGAEDALRRHGVEEENVDTAWVPGAFEIPLIAKRWRTAANTMPLSHLAQSSADLQLTLNTLAMKQQKG